MMDWKKWNRDQMEWYKKEIEWQDKYIDSLTRDLQRQREEDRELQRYIWSKGVLTKIEMQIWGGKTYESSDYKKIKNMRRREYLSRKRNYKTLAQYEKLVAEDRTF